MTFIHAEIALQPESWLKSVAVARSEAVALPAAGERVAVVGCGTSWFMAEAYARLREDARLGLTDAWAASEFPYARQYDRVIVISRSGTTTEVIDLLGRVRGQARTTVLTGVANSPVVDHADDVIGLEFADERSVVQTLFATTALATLRAHLGHDVAALSAAARTVVGESVDERWLSAEQITFLGRGWAHGIAREAALKMREAAQFWTEAYPSMEYRHGPISIAAPGRLVWHFGPDVEQLRPELDRTGALFVDHDADPMVDLIRVQHLAAELAFARGLDPDRPRNLTRSVVLSND